MMSAGSPLPDSHVCIRHRSHTHARSEKFPSLKFVYGSTTWSGVRSAGDASTQGKYGLLWKARACCTAQKGDEQEQETETERGRRMITTLKDGLIRSSLFEFDVYYIKVQHSHTVQHKEGESFSQHVILPSHHHHSLCFCASMAQL